MLPDRNIHSRQFIKRRCSLLLIASIYSTQLAVAAVLTHFSFVTNNPLLWTSVYYIISFIAAVPQAGFSDEFGRKKHLLIASISVLTAVVWLFTTEILKILLSPIPSSLSLLIFIIPVCLLLGLSGNVIPIARGCLASLKLHDFQAAIGLTTSAIGLGWITADFLTLAIGSNGVLFFSIFLQLTVIICIKFLCFFEGDQLTHEKNQTHGILRKSYLWTFSMLLVTGGSAALGAYLETEITFYQVYNLDELPSATLGKKIIGSLMGIGYSIGVATQWIANTSKKNSIKFGVCFSLFCLLILFCVSCFFFDMDHKNIYLTRVNGLLQFFFAFGFGFFVPALFALMSNHVHPRHIGRLFGAIDSTDTAALYLSLALLKVKAKLDYRMQIFYLNLLLLFLISIVLYHRVIKVFRSYEKN
jgi:hypothetical protein